MMLTTNVGPRNRNQEIDCGLCWSVGFLKE
jgi:hypothetical protein